MLVHILALSKSSFRYHSAGIVTWIPSSISCMKLCIRRCPSPNDCSAKASQLSRTEAEQRNFWPFALDASVRDCSLISKMLSRKASLRNETSEEAPLSLQTKPICFTGSAYNLRKPGSCERQCSMRLAESEP